MKKALPQKKKAVATVKTAVTRGKKVSPCQKSSCKTVAIAEKKKSPRSSKHSATSAKNKCDALPPLNPSLQAPSSLSETNPPMISLKNCADKESLAYSENSYGTQQRKKASRKKGRHPKTVRDRSFYDLDEEVDFELEGPEFLDDELISLDEFDSILQNTKGKTFKGREVKDDLKAMEPRKIENGRKDSPHSPGPDKPTRRKKVQRRRQIDPTTCERDYTMEEVEFMTALDEYKRNSGRMFPTCSEILEVLINLGYAKAPAAEEQIPPPSLAGQGQTVINTMSFGETHVLTNFTTAIQPTAAFVSGQEYSSFLLSDSFLVIEMSILPDGFVV